MREYHVRICERHGVKLPGPTRQVAVRERGWNIIRVDGDGAVHDAARQSGHWASPLFCAQWRAATVGGNSAW